MDLLIQSLVGLRWQDVVDILLNSYILFRLYVLFRGTNVIRMVIAIAMLWILERVATSMGLIVTSWAMQGIIAAAALIIIIVFRNEIAGVLQTRSLRSFFWGIPQRQMYTPVEIIVDSVFEMARQKMGALIVLPLKKGIESVVHGGVAWQGKLSREMLLSIFWHGTPVHDGAIVIQGDRVVDVGVILPLSKSTDLPFTFGTRHRAAFGLTEQTDALVLVVSEERGEITVFKDQSIIKIKDNIELNQLLHKYAGTIPASNGSRNQKMELGVAAMICLAGIMAIWFSFARGFETFTTLDVPIEFMNRAPKMELFASSANSVKLLISGSGSLIRSVRPDQVKVKLDLAHAVIGSNHLTITADSIVLPPGVVLKQVEPQELKVNLDVPEQKNLPIQPDWTGKLPDGLIMQEAHTIPETVKVVGGSLALKNIQTLYTDKIPLDNITADGKTTSAVVLQPSYLKLDDESQDHVQVLYKIVKRPPSSGDEGK